MWAKVRRVRGDCMYDSDLWKEDAKKPNPICLQDADAAAASVTADKSIRAVALALAAGICVKLADEIDRQADRETKLAEAGERFRQAIKAAPGHHDSWKWREKLAQLL